MSTLLYWVGILLTLACGFVAGALWLEGKAKDLVAQIFDAYRKDVEQLLAVIKECDDEIAQLQAKLPADTKEDSGTAEGGK